MTMQQTPTNQGKTCVEYYDCFENDGEQTVIANTTQEKSGKMTAESPRMHPAASQLARNLTSEKWNATATSDIVDGFNLISFSPGSAGYKKSESTAFSDVTTYSTVQSEVQSSLKSLRSNDRMLMLEKEKRILQQKRETLRDSIEDMKVHVEGSKTTVSDLEAVMSTLTSELEGARAEEKRVLDDIATTKRVYHDYLVKSNELLPVLSLHKQNDQDLRELLEKKMAELFEKVREYQNLKKEAESTKAKLASEVAMCRAAMEREVGALQAKLKREQMAVSSMTSSLEDKRRENEELTKICDELIAGVERKS